MYAIKIVACLVVFHLSFFCEAQIDTLQRKMFRDILFMSGTWDVEVDSRVSMNGPWQKSKGVAVFQLSLDSALLEEYFDGVREGKHFLSKTFFAVNNLNHRHQRIFIDAPHGVMLDFEGRMEGDDLIYDRSFTNAAGKLVRMRVVYQKQGTNQFKLETMRMPQGSNEWDVNGRMVYTRKQ